MDSRVNFDSVAKASRYSAVHATPTKHSVNYLPFRVGSRTVQIPESQHHSVATQEAVFTIRPQSAILASMTSSQETVVEILGHSSVYDELYLELTILNTSGGAVNLGFIGNLIDRMEIRLGSGEVVLQKSSEMFWLDNLHLATEDFESLRSVMGLDATYSADASASNDILAGARKTYWLPLRTFLSTGDLALDLIKDKIYIHFFLRPVSPITGVAASFSLDSLQLAALGRRISPSDLAHRRRKYNEGVCHRFSYPLRHEKDMTLAASATYDERIDSFHNLITDYVVMLRASPLTAAAYATTIPLSTSYLRMQDGTNYDTARSAEFIQKIVAPRHYDSKMTASKALYPQTFATYPSVFEKKGIMSGYHKFSGAERLVFSTPSTLAPGNYRLGIYAKSAASIVIKGCRLSVERS